MNLPNQLTVARLVLTVFFVISLSVPWAFANTVALAVFVVASITDYFDGEIARRRGIVTNFGKLMDPLADKLLTAAFICLVGAHIIAPWMAIVIIAREFLITGLRMLAAGRGQILPADKLGKHKMAWQIIVVIFFLLYRAVEELVYGHKLSVAWLRPHWDAVGMVLMAVAVGLTIYSGARYLWNHRALLAEF
jgi:CDP-diacylglycerol--glycerol-3-phosphate 3-phosphatidyltransferase